MRTPALLALLALAACGGSGPGEVLLQGGTMGTRYSVKMLHDGKGVDALQDEIESLLDGIEDEMSTYRPASEISRFNAEASTDWFGVSRDFCRSIERALEISALTGGAFDITVEPLVDLWGFGPGKIVQSPPPDEAIDALLANIGYEHLHADCDRPALRKDIEELMLDMSAFGKGLAVDRVADLLDHRGIDNYLVEVGGELRLRGHNPGGESWAIGIELPLDDERRPHTIVHLTDTAMATSGDYRNFFISGGQRYSHLIDTRTGRPVTHALASVTVIDAVGYRADALATALLVMGPQDGMRFALRENLSVLFLVRRDDGFDELTSPAFDRLRAHG